MSPVWRIILVAALYSLIFSQISTTGRTLSYAQQLQQASQSAYALRCIVIIIALLHLPLRSVFGAYQLVVTFANIQSMHE